MSRQFVLALAVTLPLAAQVSEPPLVRVDVVVTDAEGNRVRGLTASDFEVLESGERRGIADVIEFSPAGKAVAADAKYVSLSASASPTPKRRLMVVFGDEVGAADRDAAMNFIQKHTRAGDVVSVVSEGGFDSRLASAVLQLSAYPEKKAVIVYGDAPPEAIAFARRRGVAIVKPDAIEDLASYYSLAFRSRDAGAATIKTIRPYTVRTYLPPPPLPSDDAFSDRVLLNHVIPQRNELKVDAAANQSANGDGKRTVKVNLLIPVTALSLSRDGENVTGGFDVYVSVGDGKGNFVTPSKQTHSINWPVAAVEKAGGRKMNYAIDVVLDPGPARISVGVIDHRSKKTGFTRIEVPG
jgi:hypothetical protein